MYVRTFACPFQSSHSLPSPLSLERADVMQYPNVGFDSNVRSSFPSRAQVWTYLHDFAQQHALMDIIQFNATVTRITPDAKEWRVETTTTTTTTTASGSSSLDDTIQTQTFDQVVVCNGHFTTPIYPFIPGLQQYFTGRVLHSHHYRTPQSFSGQTIVVIGKGASGQDISLELAEFAKVYIVYDMAADTDTNTDTDTADDAQDQRIHKPLVRGIDLDGKVVFQDHSTCKADVILFATGYV